MARLTRPEPEREFMKKEHSAPGESHSELLHSNLQLKQQVLFYEKIFNNVKAIVMIFDLMELRMVWGNEYLHKGLGLRRNHTSPPEKILDMYHPDDRDFLLQLKRHLEANKKDTFTALYRFRHAKGHYVWFYTCANVFRHIPEEGIFEVVAVSLDFNQPMTYHKNLKFFSQEQMKGLNHKYLERITNREKQIVKYFANGFKTREIAEMLGLSFHTVNNHRKNILKKLELKNLAALVNFAVENGLD